MSTTISTPNNSLVVQAQQLDKVVKELSTDVALDADSFEQCIRLARGLNDLRHCLTPELMTEIVKVQNTTVGFLTDRPNEKHPAPYSIDDLRDVIIEACLRGFHPIGNEFNVIAGRFYAAKNGLRRKLYNYPGLTDFKETPGVPKNFAEKGSIVPFEASWKKDGVEGHFYRDIAVRLNFGMGTDAAIGKAQRKAYAAILDQLSGVITPEGEVGDVPIEPSQPEIKKPEIPLPPHTVKAQGKLVDALKRKMAEDYKAPEAAKQAEAPRGPQTAADFNLEMEQQAAPPSLLEQIKARMAADPQLTHDGLLHVLKINGLVQKHVEHLEEVPDGPFKIVLDDWLNAVTQMREFYQKQKNGGHK